MTNGITYGVSSLQSESISYTKDGKTMNVKQALDDLITKSSKIDDLETKVKDYENKGVHYLVDVAEKGDYVAYDAGTWGSTAAKPTTQGQFGGYTINTSKNSSVEWCYNASYNTSLKGWRVLKKEGGKVYLVHAGQPECYYHAYNSTGYSAASVEALNKRANDYKNTMYAESAHAMTKDEAQAITGSTSATDDDLRKTGDYYWKIYSI